MNRAKLITNLEAMMRFDLAHQVRRGDPLAAITLRIKREPLTFAIWHECLIDAGFPAPV
jgi:hypothetical protein